MSSPRADRKRAFTIITAAALGVVIPGCGSSETQATTTTTATVVVQPSSGDQAVVAQQTAPVQPDNTAATQNPCQTGSRMGGPATTTTTTAAVEPVAEPMGDSGGDRMGGGDDGGGRMGGPAPARPHRNQPHRRGGPAHR